MSKPYKKLQAKLKDLDSANATLALLHWDQETMMPEGAAPYRAQQISWLSRWTHEQATADEVGEWISEAEAALKSEPTCLDYANIREIKKTYLRAKKIPPELVATFSEACSKALEAWKKARASDDWSSFAPHLETLIKLNREKAEAYGIPEGGDAWDALAESYESGIDGLKVQTVFNSLRQKLIPLIQEGTAQTHKLDFKAIKACVVPIPNQKRLNAFVAGRLGYDFSRGRLDSSTHPFSQGLGPGDTRITTRYSEEDFTDGLGSTMHEVGHALYEQGLPKAKYQGQPLGEAASLGIHESQSRLWENQVGRSLHFWNWLMPHAKDFCEGALGTTVAEDWYAWVNRVQPHPIRVESDETTYNLHIMLRFDIERALIRGDLKVTDVPSVWNERMESDLGITPRNDAEGCLQDIHWAMGAIGYFPTYTLGNLYSAQFWQAAVDAIPELDQRIGEGDFEPLLAWLREHIHAFGRQYSAEELCQRVTGEALNEQPLIKYLTAKVNRLGKQKVLK